MTDENGRYCSIIDMKLDSLIMCSHANFKTNFKKIEGNNVINFVLEKDVLEYKLSLISDTITSMQPDLTAIKFIDSFALANEDRIFTSVEIQAEFPGGGNAIRNYFSRNLKISNVGKFEPLNGIVKTNFKIKIDGSISEIKIEKGIEESIDQLILKLIQQMPKWRPALQNGKYCESGVSLSIPIRRVIQ